jgi:hypothetical protein
VLGGLDKGEARDGAGHCGLASGRGAGGGAGGPEESGAEHGGRGGSELGGDGRGRGGGGVGGGVVALLGQTKTESNFAAVHGHARTQCAVQSLQQPVAIGIGICCRLSPTQANAYMSTSQSISKSVQAHIQLNTQRGVHTARHPLARCCVVAVTGPAGQSQSAR